MSAIPACAGEGSSTPQEAANAPTTYRAAVDPATRPREAAVARDHLPAIQVDPPSVDVAALLAVSHHIDSRPDLPSARRLVRARRDHAAAYDRKAPHRDPGDEAEMSRLNVEYRPNATAVH